MKIHQIKIDFYVTEQIKRYVFVYIVEGKNCYLIDSGVGGSEKMIEDYLASIGRNRADIRGIFLTHAHPDHIGTAAYFQNNTGCKVYASAGEKGWIEDIDLQFKERPIPNFFQLAGKSSIVDVTVADGDQIELDEEFTVQVLKTPGHSIDEVSYLIDDCVFIGDTVFVEGDIPIYVNKDHTLASFDKLWDLASTSMFNKFYPAWDRTYSSKDIQEKIITAKNLIEQLDRAVQSVQKENQKVDLQQLTRLVSKAVKMEHFMENPLFKRTIQSHIKD